MDLARACVVAGVTFVSQLHAVGATPRGSSPEIWFSPPFTRDRASEFASLFTPAAPWQETAAHIRVFEISGGAVRSAPEAELRGIVSDLARRQIALALGMSPLTGNERCGQGIEDIMLLASPPTILGVCKQPGAAQHTLLWMSHSITVTFSAVRARAALLSPKSQAMSRRKSRASIRCSPRRRSVTLNRLVAAVCRGLRTCSSGSRLIERRLARSLVFFAPTFNGTGRGTTICKRFLSYSTVEVSPFK